MKHKSHSLKNDIVINKLYTVHYFEFSKDYKFVGEVHNFWELVYVDKGEIICVSDSEKIPLTQGSVIFHKPGEWHSIHSNGKTASNVAIATFECNSPAMSFFENKVLKAGQEQKRLISKIVSEYTNAFATPLNEVYTTRLEEKPSQPIGAQQLIRQYLCEFLILCIRGNAQETGESYELHNAPGVNMLINYMLDNIGRSITVDELAHYSGTSPITVNRLFRKELNTTPLKFFINLKIDFAKKYIRENIFNITEMAEMLGYANVHYFSRQFKKLTGMSPTEYGASIKALTDIGIKMPD